MRFLDPTNDLAFKKIFGNNNEKDILICFLNNVLAKKKEDLIVDVHVEDPYNHPIIEVGKLSIVDVRCTDSKNTTYIVEMQVMDHKDYAQRCQYYSAYSLASQLSRKESYKEIKPVIFVGIVCFDMFKSENYLSHHLILNKETHEHGLTEMEFHFIELSKFKKSENELETIIDKWSYFLKKIYDLDRLPESVGDVPEIKKAAELLEEAKWGKKELIEYEKYWDRYRLIESKISDSREEGREEGRKEETIKLVQGMLKADINLDTVSKISGLTIEQIKKLKER